MARAALIIMLVCAATAIAGPYTPLETGAVWTYEPEPPAEFIRTHFMGGPALWHGMFGYPQLELWNVAPHVTTHWGLDDADRLGRTHVHREPVANLGDSLGAADAEPLLHEECFRLELEELACGVELGGQGGGG